MIIIGVMMATVVVFILGIVMGYRLAKGQQPIVLPKKEDIPLTKEYREKKQELDETKSKAKQYEEVTTYIELFREDDL